MPQLIYLYALSDKPEQLNQAPVFKAHPHLYMYSATVSEEEFGEEALKKNLTDSIWVERVIRDHERVVSQALERGTVIPFRFPTLFATEQTYLAFLLKNEKNLRFLHDRLKGCTEWGLKVYANTQAIENAILRDRRMMEISEEISRSNSGKAFLLTKKKMDLQKEILKEKINQALGDMLGELRISSRDFKANGIHSKEATGREDEMVMNLAFLIYKDQRQEYLSKVLHWKEKLEMNGIFLESSGPWAPYNFCDINQ